MITGVASVVTGWVQVEYLRQPRRLLWAGSAVHCRRRVACPKQLVWVLRLILELPGQPGMQAGTLTGFIGLMQVWKHSVLQQDVCHCVCGSPFEATPYIFPVAILLLGTWMCGNVS